MIVTYLRSSSYSCHDMCAMKYYLEYILGYRGSTNKKAEKGTIVHKVLEILGQIQKCLSRNIKTFDDDIVGTIDVETYVLDHIIEKVYKYYVGRSKNLWDEDEDLMECTKWTSKAITYRGGEFDPRNADIVDVEKGFDITIEKPWAMYNYQMPDGTPVEGFLAIKGTIDQISRIDDETILILDWKTGRRWDWAKDTEKTFEHLQNDHQLMMYYYAAHILYPDVKHIMVTIYFINDGGPFSVIFSKEDIPRIERMLQKKFEDIKNTEIPARNRSWKCGKFCHYGTNTFKGTTIVPMIEKRFGEVCLPGTEMTMCEQITYCLKNRPEASVIKHMSAPGHTVDFYKAPGS